MKHRSDLIQAYLEPIRLDRNLLAQLTAEYKELRELSQYTRGQDSKIERRKARVGKVLRQLEQRLHKGK